MQAVLDEHDYQIIADKVLQQITEKYDLVPKQPQNDQWVSLKEFTKQLPIIKDKEWVRMFILARPEFEAWVINLNAGKGYRTKVNATQGLAWINDHQAEIDWNQSLPR